MRTTSQINKLLATAIGMLVCGIAAAAAAPTVDQARLNAYRESFKDAVTPINYIFTHVDESPCCDETPGKKVYLLNIRQTPPAKLIYSPEIDKLFKQHFTVEVDPESLISTAKADYLVLTMSRPAEYNRKYVRCAAGMGESRSYLVSVAGDKLTVIDRELGGCNRQHQTLRGPAATGYEISEVIGTQKLFTYVLRGDSLVREGRSSSKGEK